MSAIAAVRHGRADDVMGRLVALVRPEFNTAVIRPDPDDPVLAGSRCTVGDCDRRPVRSLLWSPIMSKDRHSFFRIMRWHASCNPARLSAG